MRSLNLVLADAVADGGMDAEKALRELKSLTKYL